MASESKDVQRFFIFDLAGSCQVGGIRAFLALKLTDAGGAVNREFRYCGLSGVSN